MLLPKQAEPVRVTIAEASRHSDDQGALPQVTCVCKQTGALPTDTTWVCILGRDLWNTGQPCTP